MPRSRANAARTRRADAADYVVLTSRQPRRPADGGAGAFRGVRARDQAHASRDRGRGADAGFPGRAARRRDRRGQPGLDVFAQNVETVRRLTHPVRDPRAGYEQTLAVLAHAKRHRPGVLTKTSLMLGLGETDDEILDDDGRPARRRRRHAHARAVPAADRQSPARRALRHAGRVRRYRAAALARGFRECVSGPLVRSSYRAEQALPATMPAWNGWLAPR